MRRARRWRRLRSLLYLLILGGGLIWLAFSQSPPREGDSWQAYRGVTVLDGDSFRLNGNGDVAGEIRLEGIDAPEYDQSCRRASGTDWPCGREARAAMQRLLAEQGLACSALATDRYARHIARCRTGSTPDIAAALVSGGWAVITGRGISPAYGAEEGAARTARRGIWQGSFDRPADWRARHGSTPPP